ncbi:flagellar basal body-associated FliL family protein [Roseicitreum antarcticum]|uniref:Flagellar protein FliL n=1 Tax=Roseicitreum antarcticum TaxID=564137 RepID=A0A1H3A2W3_9RHOB|nr:flagellar basal body-associated FliL family protein [Roseicitreum antarcticum]SDX23953.1 hypothetical protein SAMN04488238_106181 [Roseicitreum antarcticum]
MAKLLPILIVLLGLFGGVGAGFALKPPAVSADAAGETAEGASGAAPGEAQPSAQPDAQSDAQPGARASPPAPQAPLPPLEARELAVLANQFFVPVIEEDKVVAMVALSLTLEVVLEYADTALLHEPRLRDAFLQVMFDHANIGGFDGVYTAQRNMTALRTALRETGQRLLGSALIDVLITEIVRQET